MLLPPTQHLHTLLFTVDKQNEHLTRFVENQRNALKQRKNRISPNSTSRSITQSLIPPEKTIYS